MRHNGIYRCYANHKASPAECHSSPQIAQQVERLAKRRRLSDNRVLVELIEQGIEATKQKEQMFFELAERFHSSKDPDVAKKLGDELGRFVFGE